MTNETEDLWPELSSSTIVTPAAILKMQAAVLARKTNGLIQAEVETWTVENNIYHVFKLLVPALENYRYSLLKLHHSMILYPLYVDESPLDGDRPRGLRPSPMPPTTLDDEEAFREWLRRALRAPATQRVLESLLAQAVA